MTELATALRIMERRNRPVLSSVGIWVGCPDIGSAAGHATSPMYGHTGPRPAALFVCLPDGAPWGEDYRCISLIHELVHIAQFERGWMEPSGVWYARFLAGVTDPETLNAGIRRYYARWPSEAQADRVAVAIAGTPTERERYEAAVRE